MEVSLFNVTKDKKILTSVHYATSFIQRFKGLIPYHKINLDAGMFLFNCSSIHTFFMKFSIDCYFLDSNNKVVEIIFDIKPHRLVFNKASSIKHVLEVSSEREKKLDIEINDILRVN